MAHIGLKKGQRAEISSIVVQAEKLERDDGAFCYFVTNPQTNLLRSDTHSLLVNTLLVNTLLVNTLLVNKHAGRICMNA